MTRHDVIYLATDAKESESGYSMSDISCREGWANGQRLKNDVIHTGAIALKWFVGALPLSWAMALGAFMGLLGWIIVRGERRKTLAQLEIAYPELDTADRIRLGRRCFTSLGRRAAEICHLDRLELSSYVTLADGVREHIEDALRSGRGLLWVTAHFGNWEFLAGGLAAHGYDVRPIATPSYDPRFTDLIDRWRRGLGVRTIWRGRDDLASAVSEALSEGAIVGLLIDQDTKTKGHFVPYFGRLAWTPSGAAELARLSGAPALIGFIERDERRGHIIRAATAEMRSGGDIKEDDRANTARFTEAIEEAVRARPEEWVWMHERWRTTPGSLEVL